MNPELVMKQNIFVFIGPPGSGKGSLSQLCVQKLSWKQLSTGALCRKHISEGTSIGREIDFAIKSGKLIADNLVLDMVTQWLSQVGGVAENIIFDGFPRTVPQAQALMQLLSEKFAHCTLTIVEFSLSDAEAITRLAGRFVCKGKECQAVYSVTTELLSSKNDMTCDICNQSLERRSDDEPVTVKQRLATYHKHAKPLLDFYRQSGQTVATVDVDKPLESVFKEFVTNVAR